MSIEILERTKNADGAENRRSIQRRIRGQENRHSNREQIFQIDEYTRTALRPNRSKGQTTNYGKRQRDLVEATKSSGSKLIFDLPYSGVLSVRKFLTANSTTQLKAEIEAAEKEVERAKAVLSRTSGRSRRHSVTRHGRRKETDLKNAFRNKIRKLDPRRKCPNRWSVNCLLQREATARANGNERLANQIRDERESSEDLRRFSGDEDAAFEVGRARQQRREAEARKERREAEAKEAERQMREAEKINMKHEQLQDQLAEKKSRLANIDEQAAERRIGLERQIGKLRADSNRAIGGFDSGLTSLNRANCERGQPTKRRGWWEDRKTSRATE